MIIVTRLNGAQFGVNPDLLQRVDSAPDTILTLIDGTKYIVRESMAEVIARVNEHRAHLLARAQEIQASPHPAVELVRDVDTDAAATAADAPDDGDEPLADPVPLRPRSR
ncbi:flagellar FlbD family protein [Cellulomonas sp. Marseille-Q8402]